MMTLWMFAACVVAGEEQSWMVTDPFTKVDVDARNGDVTVTARQRDGAAVEWAGGGVGSAQTPEVIVEDGVLRVDTRCEGLCGGSLTLSVPDDVAVSLQMDAGDAQLMLPMPVDVCVDVGAGNVDLSIPGGAYALDVEVGAGSFDLHGVWDDEAADHSITGSLGAGSLTIAATDG
jgi:hypothetical protein